MLSKDRLARGMQWKTHGVVGPEGFEPPTKGL